MKTYAQVFLSLVTVVAYVGVLQMVPSGGIISMIVVGVTTLTAAAVGPRLHLALRVFITAIIFEFGYSMCLVGRTMEPGFTRSNFGMALCFFAMFAALPFLSLLRLWHRHAAIALLAAALPVSIGMAASVAAFEEDRFVQHHRDNGIGPTARWTVSNHWLAYDALEQRLYGSD